MGWIQRVRQAFLLIDFISFVSQRRIFTRLEASVVPGLVVGFRLGPARGVPQIVIQIANLLGSCRIGNVFLLAVLPRDTHEITDLQPSVARIGGRPVLNVRKVWIGGEQLRETLLPAGLGIPCDEREGFPGLCDMGLRFLSRLARRSKQRLEIFEGHAPS